MPRERATILRELVGKLTVLQIECEECGRSGQYWLDRLIMRYGIDARRDRGRLPAPFSESISARGQHDPYVRIEWPRENLAACLGEVVNHAPELWEPAAS